MCAAKFAGNEPSSPRSSVNVHRSNTSRRPFLSLDPVQYSLTDGTAIPPPPKEHTPPDSPVSPIKEESEPKTNGHSKVNTDLSATTNGPLSSHPVTPIEAPNGSVKSFPFNRQGSNSVGSQTANGRTGRVASPNGHGTPLRATTPNTASPLSHHQHNGMPQPGRAMTPPESEDYHNLNPPHGRHSQRNRRPSFAERFLRFRSISSLRSRNSSNTSFAQTQHVHNDGSQFVDGAGDRAGDAHGHGSLPARGTKRPGSAAGLFRSADSTNGNLDEPGQRGSQSFPRMVRKKSMELLGTARRKSGMWSGRDTMNDMMAQEYERERMREQEMDGKTDAESSMDVDRSMSKSTHRRESLKEPPPMLPELSGFKEMEGESMFSSIGKTN